MPKLNIPSDAKCLTPGCKRTPDHVFSFRMRRKDTGASWAPNLPAFLCDVCANSGASLTVLFEPNKSKVVKFIVIGVKSGSPVYREFDLQTKRDVKSK